MTTPEAGPNGAGGRAPILVLGGGGQIGWELRRSLAPLGAVTAPDRAALDLADGAALRAFLRAAAPALIVNAAAYTAVDKAEEAEVLATAVNGAAPGILAEEAARQGIPLVHYSTDYVFGGGPAGKDPRPLRESDPPAPVNAYGRSKLAGEQAIRAAGTAHLILRTSWIYGLRGANFLLTIRRLAREHEELRIVDDQIGAPTWARMVAEATAAILARSWAPGSADPLSGKGGLYHLSAAGSTSWHGFTEAILDRLRKAGETGLKVGRVIPIPTSEFPRPAPRPAYSILDNGALARAFGLRLPDWESQLALCLAR